MRDKFQFIIYHVRVILLSKYNIVCIKVTNDNYTNRIKVSESKNRSLRNKKKKEKKKSPHLSQYICTDANYSILDQWNDGRWLRNGYSELIGDPDKSELDFIFVEACAWRLGFSPGVRSTCN